MATRNRIVCVHGIRQPDGALLPEDILWMFFERSGNGRIVALRMDQDKAWITFEDSSYADSVLAKRHYNVMGYKLTAISPNTSHSLSQHGDAHHLVTSETTLPTEGTPFSRESVQMETSATSTCSDKTTSVLIENVPPSMNKEHFEELIDHPRKGIIMDGSILSVNIDQRNSEATIKFSSASDARSLLYKGFLEWQNRKMAVKKLSAPAQSSVLVTGLSKTEDKEMFELYFSNAKKSGGDEINEMKFFEPSHSFAVIVYADKKAAEAVVQKKIHKVRHQTLIATPYMPGEEGVLRKGAESQNKCDESIATGVPKSEQSLRSTCEVNIAEPRPAPTTRSEGSCRIVYTQEEENEDEEGVKSCTILVEGIPQKIGEETVRRFFENRTKSGGGAIESLRKCQDGNYVIVFKERVCVDRLLRRRHLALDDNPIHVEEIKSQECGGTIQGPTEPWMIYVNGDLSKLSKDALVLYIEEVSKSTVQSIVYGLEGVALVTFRQKFMYDTLRREVLRKPVENVMISVSRVECSCTIQVHSARPMSEFVLKLYFENEGRSGGSEGANVEKIGEHVYLVHFTSAIVAENVARRKHLIDGNELKVSMFRHILGFIPPGYDTSKPSIKIPPPEVVKVDPHLLKYLRGNKTAFQNATDHLNHFHGRIDVSHPQEDEIKVLWEPNEQIEDVWEVVENWNNTISGEVNTVLSTYNKSIIQCLPQHWHEFLVQLQEYKKTKDISVMIEVIQESYTVVVIGPVHDQQVVENDLNQVCQEVQESVDQDLEEMDVPHGKLEVLKKMHIEKELLEQFPKVSVTIDEEAEKMVFQGKPGDILKAIKHIGQQLTVIHEFEMPFSIIKADVIRSPQGWQHIQSLLLTNELSVHIKCVNNDRIIIYGYKDQIKGAETLLTIEIQESTIQIPKESRHAFKGTNWENFRKKYLKENTGKIEVSDDLSSITIAAVADQCNMSKESLENYLRMNTVKTQFVPVAHGTITLLKRHSMEDIAKIESDLIDYNVAIKVDDKRQESGFIVTGGYEGLDRAVKRIKSLIATVVVDSQVCQPDLPKLMSEEQKYFKDGVESNYSVVIKFNQTKDISQTKTLSRSDARQEIVLDSVKTQQVSIRVVVGDLTENKADAVVCPTDQTMKNKGGLAQALVQKGGSTVQEECDKHIQFEGNMQVGDVVMTNAGTLPCKKIIHTLIPGWKGDKKQVQNCLLDCVTKCLGVAENENLESIAFPPLGINYMNVPVRISTKCVVEAVRDLVSTGTNCSIRNILLVDKDQSNAEHFVVALKTYFGATENSMQANTARNWNDKDPKVKTAKAISANDSSLVTQEGITIKLVQGEIAKQKTEAIVNSVSSDANLSMGVLSSSIMSEMDQASKTQVQAEADKKKGKGLAPGQFISTEAGNLPCKHIYHIVLPMWQSNPPNSKVLQKALNEVLSEAHKNGITSLAIPSLGTGRLQWPADVVAAEFFNAVIRLSSEQRTTKLKKIYFIIFPSDSNSMTGFVGHLKKLQSQSGKRVRRKLEPSQEFDEATGPVGTVEGETSEKNELKIGKGKLQVTTGNITQETTDAIVNSSNADLDLSKGAVSQAMAKAGGTKFKTECQKQGGIRAGGLAVTGAGSMRCKYVIHFDAWSKPNQLKDAVSSCLKKAEELKLQSVTFPALGTGALNQTPEDTAMLMFEAISNFFKKDAMSVNLVRIMIFQKKMLDSYIAKMDDMRREKPSLFGIVKRWFGYGSNQPEQDDDAGESSCELSVSLDIYAFSKENIAKAREEINKFSVEQKADLSIGGTGDPTLREIIRQLKADQIQWILKRQNNGVKITIEPHLRHAQIRIKGHHHKDAYQIESVVKKYLHKLDKHKHENEEAQTLSQYVQWEYEDKPKVFKPYDETTNGRLEKAYQQKKSTISLVENLGDGVKRTVVIDITNLTEKVGGRSVQIRRRDISADILPDHWRQENQGRKCDRIRLDLKDEEYITVSSAFHKTISKNTILKIERLENPTLYRRYFIHKKDMEEKYKVKKSNTTFERWLFHATTIKVIENINNNNFNRSYCGSAYGTWFGKGVYFARDASYSNKFAKEDEAGQRYMYYANVLTGQYCQGNDTMIEPPAIDTKDPSTLYDSSVDDVTNPGQFVVYLDTQMYPHYLITFK